MSSFRILIGFCLVQLILVSCKDQEAQSPLEPDGLKSEGDCHNYIFDQGLFYKKGEDFFLWGGEDSSTHFRVTNWTLDPCKLNNGLGREHFNALRNPKFEHINRSNFDSLEKVVSVFKADGNVRVYPLTLLRKYETINDVVDGNSIAIVFCYLADLTAVYDRTIDGHTLTFGVSGFTYSDQRVLEGLESFILWDRNTESLWWPIIDRAVSGSFRGKKMDKTNRVKWEEGYWHEIKHLYPNARVLSSNQE